MTSGQYLTKQNRRNVGEVKMEITALTKDKLLSVLGFLGNHGNPIPISYIQSLYDKYGDKYNFESDKCELISENRYWHNGWKDKNGAFKDEDVNYSIDELYKQLRYCLHISTNCDDGTFEIHRLIGQAVDKCREQKEKQMDETTLTIVTELFDDESKPREVLACTKCGQSYKTRHDVINFCSNCGRKIVGERPLSK